MAHSAAREKARGRVELWEPVPKPETPDENPWDAPLDTERPDSAETVLARKIARAIKSSIANKEILPSTLAPAQAGDFLILLRKRTRLAAPIIRALKAEGVPVAGADRLKLTDSIATLDLMALMRASLMPDDDYALACTLKSPLFRLDDNDLMEIAIDRPDSLADALHAHRGNARIEAAAARFSALAGIARRERPFTFLAHVLGAEDGRLAYRKRLGNEADDVLDELADRALAFERANVASVTGFLAWLERSGGEIKRDLDEGGDAVRVMTVHGAKGLEAPVVFVADTCSPPGGQRDPLLVVRDDDIFAPLRAVLWNPGKALRTDVMQRLAGEADTRGEEELHRLLYVAMTRAQDRLVICGAETGRKRSDGCWYNLVEAALADRLEEQEDGVRVFMPDTPGIAPVAEEQEQGSRPSEQIPDWARQPMEARPKPVWQAASKLGIGTHTGGAGGQAARKRGSLVHLLLEHLPELAEDKRRQAGEALLEVHARDWDAEQREAVLGPVLKLMSDPAFAFLFGAGSRAEASLAGTVRRAGGDDMISVAGRIDRLIIGGGTITIADYKTGGPVPSTPEGTPEPYVAQLAAYAALLSAIHPQKTIDAVLIWTDAANGPEVTRLPAEMLGGFEASDRLTVEA
ncbi:MAG: PD-(D/E)XK nuclease family protein [Rhodobiaceae bacterium]|nr:PD-(D/E)XK nuclease family protein [Rhodobiaceae bacterium]